MLELRWSIEGREDLVRRLRGISDKLQDWRPAFEETAHDLKEIFANDVFDTEGRAIGQPWAPLSPAYAAYKAQKYPGKGILEASGKMRKSFQTLVKPDMAAIWNTAAYFKYHQSNQPRFHLPRRAMMALAEQQKQLIVKIFHTYFLRKIKE